MTPEYFELKRALIQRTGLAYYEDKDPELLDILGRRVQAAGRTSLEDYARWLGQGDAAAELDELIGALTIGETHFFRHPELLAGFQEVVLPELIRRRAERRELHIWSAGCATGAEAYTVAILVRSVLGLAAHDWQVNIVGTDINRRALEAAIAGRYGRWSLRGVPEATATSHFQRDGDEWVIRPHHREWVQFRQHNLLSGPWFPMTNPPGAAWDVIFCRNVLIYFAQDVIRRLAGQFHQSLAPDGWLLVGHAEPNVETFRDFDAVNVTGAVLYRKPPGPRTSLPPADPAPSLPVHGSEGARGRSGKDPAEGGFPRGRAPGTGSPVAVGRHAPGGLPPREPAPPPTAPDTARATAALMDAGDWAAALRSWDDALSREGARPERFVGRGQALEQLGRPAEAEAAYRRALYLDPGFALGHYHLARLLLRAGRTDAARKSLANARQILVALAPGQVLDVPEGLTVAGLLDLVTLSQKQLQPLAA